MFIYLFIYLSKCNNVQQPSQTQLPFKYVNDTMKVLFFLNCDIKKFGSFSNKISKISQFYIRKTPLQIF
jgi:hypothetical protein